jgi:hypothetical protein
VKIQVSIFREYGDTIQESDKLKTHVSAREGYTSGKYILRRGRPSLESTQYDLALRRDHALIVDRTAGIKLREREVVEVGPRTLKGVIQLYTLDPPTHTYLLAAAICTTMSVGPR